YTRSAGSHTWPRQLVRAARGQPHSPFAAPAGSLAAERAPASFTHTVAWESGIGPLPVLCTSRELSGHGAVFGGPGSGETTLLPLLIEASAGRMSGVVVDPKGWPALAQRVRARGGLVWTLDGPLGVDLLDERPWQVQDLLHDGWAHYEFSFKDAEYAEW